jgi:hypothetical protein
MTRSFKLLILTVLAISAIGGDTAAAAAFEKPPGPITSTITPDGSGKNKHKVWDIPGHFLTCAEENGTFTSGDAASQISQLISAAWNYIGCVMLGQEATVSMNGCNYAFHASGVTDILCPPGNEITFSIPSPPCDVKIPAQSGLGTVTYSNINGETEITVSQSITGISGTAVGAGCPATGSFTNGNVTTGNFILTAEKDDGTKTMVKLRRTP